MTLQEATVQAARAAEAGDLDEVARALDARAQAIASGATPDEATLASGEQLDHCLRDLIARLKQISSGFAPASTAPRFDHRG